MFKELNSKRGVTWLEVIMGVAIFGILAGLAVPSHQDRTREERLSEVVTTLDLLAESACEHHAATGSFAADGYVANNLWYLKHKYAAITIENSRPADGSLNFVANFRPVLDLTRVVGSEGVLRVELVYDGEQGYVKTWDAASTIDGMYMPEGSGVRELGPATLYSYEYGRR